MSLRECWEIAEGVLREEKSLKIWWKNESFKELWAKETETHCDSLSSLTEPKTVSGINRGYFCDLMQWLFTIKRSWTKCSASDIYDLEWKHFWAKYKWDCILFLSTLAMGQAEIHTKCILKQLNTFLEVGSNALQPRNRKLEGVNIPLQGLFYEWSESMHLLLRSQLSTHEVWNRWRQASLLTMLPERKSPRQITQCWLPSFTRPPPSLGLKTEHISA